MKHLTHDSADNFESVADPAHASAFSEPGASDAGSGAVRGRADPRGSREAGARSHEADALHAAEPARAEGKSGEEENPEKVSPDFVPYTTAMDELFVHLQAQKLPKVVHTHLGIVLQNPVKLMCVVGDSESALGATRPEPGLYASKVLRKLIQATRTLDWELVAILLEHADTSYVDETEITEQMIAAGYSALATPLHEPWINGEFIDWIEATTHGRNDVHPAINLLLRKVYRTMNLASAHETSQEPHFL